jgi:predicted Zn-dependent peptidase
MTPQLDPQVETATLDNGLAVTTVALAHLHTAACALFVKAGSRFERPADNGLSHFVEHMLFRGTERYPTSLALTTAVEQLGTTLHAETGRDNSLFQLSLDPDNLDAGIALLGELLGRPRFSDIERERALILEEINEDYDEDGVEINADDLARGALFGDAPLGQRIIGPRANVERFSIADVRRHFAAFYGARNMRLCVTGPVSHARVVESARHALSGLPSGASAEFTPAPSFSSGPKVIHVPDAGSQTEFTVLFRAVPELDPAYVSLLALLRVLDGGMSTRLHYTLADQKGLAYSIHAAIEPLADASLLEVTGTTAHAKVPALVKELFALLDGLREGRVTETELATAKGRYRYETLASIDDASAMAGWFGGAALYYPPKSLTQRLADIAAVTVDDVVRVAREVFTPARMVVAAVGTLPKARLAELKRVVRDWR